MARRRTIDWVNWRLYRRTWTLCVLAALVVLATSFRPQSPPEAQMPPAVSDAQAAALVHLANDFDDRYPDRRPGSPGGLESAQWVLDELDDAGLRATTVPAATIAPGSNEPRTLANVEAWLPGRTAQTVVIVAHRDNAGLRDPGNDPLGTAMLVHLAQKLNATRDRRRSYLLVSTDAATINGAGARALAERLNGERRGRIVSVIVLDRLGSSEASLHVPVAPAGRLAQPLGLTMAARAAVEQEGGSDETPSLVNQLLRLGAPITLREQGQLLEAGLPAVTLTRAAGERPRGQRTPVDEQEAAMAMRTVERLLGTVDALDAMQSAGKTYLLGADRVWRGWALKILIASMLLPFWIAVADLVVRLRRRWNLVGAVGSVCRSMLAGIWAVGTLWLLAAAGVLPRATDRPPSPATLEALPLLGVVVWVGLAIAGWLLSRGPDWRRTGVVGRDHAVIGVGLLVLGVLSAIALAVNPYSVLYALPALHAWLWLASRFVHARRHCAMVWAVGLVGPLLGGIVVASSLDAGWRSPWYWLALVSTRTVPATLALLAASGAGISLLLLLAARGSVGDPALPRLLRLSRRVRDGQLSVPRRRQPARSSRGGRVLEAGSRPAAPSIRRRRKPSTTRRPARPIEPAAPAAPTRGERRRRRPPVRTGPNSR